MVRLCPLWWVSVRRVKVWNGGGLARQARCVSVLKGEFWHGKSGQAWKCLLSFGFESNWHGLAGSVRSVFTGLVSVRSVVVRIGRLGQVNWGRVCSVPVRSVSAGQAGCGTVWRGFVGCVRFGSGAVRLAWRVLMCWGSFSWGRDKVWRARCVLVS